MLSGICRAVCSASNQMHALCEAGRANRPGEPPSLARVSLSISAARRDASPYLRAARFLCGSPGRFALPTRCALPLRLTGTVRPTLRAARCLRGSPGRLALPTRCALPPRLTGTVRPTLSCAQSLALPFLARQGVSSLLSFAIWKYQSCLNVKDCRMRYRLGSGKAHVTSSQSTRSSVHARRSDQMKSLLRYSGTCWHTRAWIVGISGLRLSCQTICTSL